jgi:hypothetical protein
MPGLKTITGSRCENKGAYFPLELLSHRKWKSTTQPNPRRKASLDS